MKNPEDSSLSINVRLLRKVQRAILRFPAAYDQNDCGESFGFDPKKDKEPYCGSAACIGGWATLLHELVPLSELSRSRRDPFGILHRAKRYLGLTEDQAERLFDAVSGIYSEVYSFWPAKYAVAYCRAKTDRGRARVAARRIEHFIKTKGAE